MLSFSWLLVWLDVCERCYLVVVLGASVVVWVLNLYLLVLVLWLIWVFMFVFCFGGYSGFAMVCGLGLDVGCMSVCYLLFCVLTVCCVVCQWLWCCLDLLAFGINYLSLVCCDCALFVCVLVYYVCVGYCWFHLVYCFVNCLFLIVCCCTCVVQWVCLFGCLLFRYNR